MPSRSRADLQLFLDRLMRRSVLSREEQEAVLNLPSHAEQVGSNRDLFSLGEKVDHSCVIVAGLVGRFGAELKGSRQITAIHIPGDMPDLYSMVQPRAGSALQTLSVVTLLRIPISSVRAAGSRYPALAEAFWRDCMVDAAILSQWVVNVGRKDAKARIAHLICEMATRIGGAPSGGAIAFDFPINQQHLADATGLTTVHVNRTLKTLRGCGVLEWRRNNPVRIPDWDALARIGDFDPEYLQIAANPQARL